MSDAVSEVGGVGLESKTWRGNMGLKEGIDMCLRLFSEEIRGKECWSDLGKSQLGGALESMLIVISGKSLTNLVSRCSMKLT